jgi:hypothetical protein
MIFWGFQSEIDEAVKVLLVLKAEYKTVTGIDWKPGSTPPAASGGDIHAINEKIVAQGNKVRDMKAAKAPKVCIVDDLYYRKEVLQMLTKPISHCKCTVTEISNLEEFSQDCEHLTISQE